MTPAATLTRTDAAARAVEATKVYGSGDTAVVALDEVSVEFPTGRFTAIMGPSGSGKSTLMHVVAGLDTLTEGQVFIGDVELGTLSDKELTLLRRTAGRLRVPGVQPGADAHRPRERRPAAHAWPGPSPTVAGSTKSSTPSVSATG